VANLESTVALFIFRRPDATARVLERILAAGPRRLLVVADGPRADKPGERELCLQTRSIIHQARSVCDVVTNFAEDNLGLRRRFSDGLDWVFEQSDRAIILEDDCLPEPSFFPFCDEMLQRFADDPRIMMVSGDNFLPRSRRFADSYHFSHFVHIWGWATWRRAWKLYDAEMKDWPARRGSNWLESKLGAVDEARLWRGYFDGVHDGRINTWDFQWQYACLVNDGLSVVPARHLVTNIGLDTAASNTFNARDPHFRAHAEPLPMPLKHPGTVQRNVEADHKEFQTLFGKPGRLVKLLRKVGKRFRQLRR
jgi:hypothetical protein